MAKDFYHAHVKEALIKDGWEITADPYIIETEDVDYEEDKVKKCQSIILAFLHKQASYRVANVDLQNQIIADTERNHFQLVRIGWRKNRFVHTCPFHFDIQDGKIWIQQNRTDVEVAETLTEMGVPASDIIIGFLPAEVRGGSGFAVA